MLPVNYIIRAVVLSCAFIGMQGELWAREYRLHHQDFGTVTVGESSTEELQEIYNGGQWPCRVDCRLASNRLGIDAHSTFRIGNSDISVVTQAFNDIHAAISRYQTDFEVEPVSFRALLDSGYFQMPDEIIGVWSFRFSGSNPITLIQAIDTSAARHTLTYKLVSGNIFGWGVTEMQFIIPPGGTLPLALSCHPDREGELLDTVFYDLGTVGDPPIVFLSWAVRANGVVMVENRTSKTPGSFTLMSPYPNPFNSTTTIRFIIPDQFPISALHLSVYRLDGRLMDEMEFGRFSAGYHSVAWSAEGLPGGIYLLCLESAGAVRTTKAVILK